MQKGESFKTLYVRACFDQNSRVSFRGVRGRCVIKGGIMQVGKSRLFGGRVRKDIDGDSGTFHRGQGGSRKRRVARSRRAIETRERQAGQKACREGRYE